MTRCRRLRLRARVLDARVRLVGEFDGNGNAATADRTLGGFLSGVDAGLGGGWRAGLATGYTQTSVSVDQRLSSADINSYNLVGYAGGGLARRCAACGRRLDVARHRQRRARWCFPASRVRERELQRRHGPAVRRGGAAVGHGRDGAGAVRRPGLRARFDRRLHRERGRCRSHLRRQRRRSGLFRRWAGARRRCCATRARR